MGMKLFMESIWKMIGGLLVILIISFMKDPMRAAYCHPFAKGSIKRVVRYKGLTRIVLQNDGNYGYDIQRDLADSLAQYARKGDWFERVQDSIKIVKGNQTTMWAIDTTNWQCTCYPWQRD
jgi:hypothetical protein